MISLDQSYQMTEVFIFFLVINNLVSETSYNVSNRIYYQFSQWIEDRNFENWISFLWKFYTKIRLELFFFCVLEMKRIMVSWLKCVGDKCGWNFTLQYSFSSFLDHWFVLIYLYTKQFPCFSPEILFFFLIYHYLCVFVYFFHCLYRYMQDSCKRLLNANFRMGV